MVEVTFRAKTRAEAEAMAEEWRKAHPEAKNVKSMVMNTRAGAAHFPPKESGRWHVTLQFDD